MAYEEALTKISVPAGADLSASQYCFVTVDSNGKVVLTGDGAKADGVLQDDPDTSTETACVAIAGVTKMKAGAAVTAGDSIASDSTGRGITAATTGDVVMGKALTGASGANALFSLLLQISAEPAA